MSSDNSVKTKCIDTIINMVSEPNEPISIKLNEFCIYDKFDRVCDF